MRRQLSLLAGPVTPTSLPERVQRRLHEPILAAVLLTLTRGPLADASTLGPRRHVVLALTNDRVWILAHRWPNTVDGIIAHFERSNARVHTHRRFLSRHHKIELSWPSDHGFLAGTIALSDTADLLIGHLAADELGGP